MCACNRRWNPRLRNELQSNLFSLWKCFDTLTTSAASFSSFPCYWWRYWVVMRVESVDFRRCICLFCQIRFLFSFLFLLVGAHLRVPNSDPQFDWLQMKWQTTKLLPSNEMFNWHVCCSRKETWTLKDDPCQSIYHHRAEHTNLQIKHHLWLKADII